jgi:lipopolysaccharide/colanic/teichoic acid biosynthesis glycosyltransferase
VPFRRQSVAPRAAAASCDARQPPGKDLKTGRKRRQTLLDAVLRSRAPPVLTPLLLLVALLVAVESRGPVFFRQRRTGYGGEIFRIYKFRTMRVCEDGPVIRQASRDDARLTRVGALLRKPASTRFPS